MRTLVLVVLHTIAVVVAHRGLAEGPGEFRDTGNKRVRHIAVVERLAILALVFEHEVFAAVHFVAYVVTHVEQVAHANVDTRGKLDIAEEVEERHLQAKAGREQHRVYQRVDRVVVVAKTHFATEFQERMEPLVHHVIHSRAVHERVGTVAKHSHEPKAGIPYERETTLGIVHFGDTRKPNHDAVRGVGIRRATVPVQKPGVAGAHTGIFPARRQVQVKHCGRPQDVGAKMRSTVLTVKLEVTEAALDHASPGRLAGIVLAVIIIDGQADTHVQVVTQAEGEIEIASKGTVDTPVFHVGIPHVNLLVIPIRVDKLARAGITPVVGGDGSASPCTEMEEPESIRVLLMQAGLSPEQARLRKSSRLHEEQSKKYFLHTSIYFLFLTCLSFGSSKNQIPFRKSLLFA